VCVCVCVCVLLSQKVSLVEEGAAGGRNVEGGKGRRSPAEKM